MLVPSWAPNIHPLLVHFPIALLITALLLDVIDAVRPRPAWLVTAAGGLYVAGATLAVAAYVSGQRAAATLVVSHEVGGVLAAHENWALATTGWFAVLATVRVAVGIVAPRQRSFRAWLVVGGAISACLLWQASGYGGRLVYEYGVGVATTPRLP